MLRSKAVSPGEVLDATLKRLEDVEPQLNAFVDITEKQARDAAKQAEKAIRSGEGIGELCGLPLSVKDLIAVKDARLTFGSRAYRDNVSSIDAPSVERARAAGPSSSAKPRPANSAARGSEIRPSPVSRRTPGT